MLYDPDTSYSAELGCDASSSVSEEFLLNRLARLNQAKPNAKLADKQKVIHFMQEKVRADKRTCVEGENKICAGSCNIDVKQNCSRCGERERDSPPK